MTHGKKAFTLIEILVVIGIIVILAALLFPVFARARQTAIDQISPNNLSQIGKAYALYAANYDQLLPHGPSMRFEQKSDNPFFSLPTVRDLLTPYGPREQTFKSPNDFFVGVDAQGNWIEKDPVRTFFVRTGTSYNLRSNGPATRRSLASASEPSRQGLAWDQYAFQGEPPDHFMYTLFFDGKVDRVRWRDRLPVIHLDWDPSKSR